MRTLKLGGSLTFATTVTLSLVFGTFLFALLSNESKRIPGVVDVSVIADSTEASVGISWEIGLLAVFIACAAISLVMSGLFQRDSQ